MSANPRRVLLVTGLSGAGKLTVLRTLEDLGWEVVDNLPLNLLRRMLGAPVEDGEAARPVAVSLGAHTRGFDARKLIDLVDDLSSRGGYDVGTLYLDCSTPELERRYSETRRRHPLALDRPARDGIAEERELLRPLKDWASGLIDTTQLKANELQAEIRRSFGGESEAEGPTLSVMSFGFSRGLPRNADLVFDMRFLRNPHWVPELRPGTGLDQAVADYVRADPAYEDAVGRIEELLLVLLPRYKAEGKSYVTVAIGCTGGKHRSVHVADRVAGRLRDAGFSPTLSHRDLTTAPQDSLTGQPGA